MNKKAQGMSTNTIILLILGLIVLVGLIWGFATGWSAFRDLVQPSNVDDIVRDCNSACSINSVYSYCNAERTLRANEENLELKTTCAVFANEPDFARKYGFTDCLNIECEKPCSEIMINGKAGDTSLTTGYDVSSLASEQTCFVPK